MKNTNNNPFEEDNTSGITDEDLDYRDSFEGPEQGPDLKPDKIEPHQELSDEELKQIGKKTIIKRKAIEKAKETNRNKKNKILQEKIDRLNNHRKNLEEERNLPSIDYSDIKETVPLSTGNKDIIEDTLCDQKNENFIDICNEADNVKPTGKPNPFPKDVLPSSMLDIAEIISNTLGSPIDYTASAMLSVAGAAIGNSKNIERIAGHQESSITYVALVGRSGSGKSPAFSLIFKPLEDRDQVNFNIYSNKCNSYKKAHSDWESLSRSSNGREQRGEEPEPPVLMQNIIKDVTPEKQDEILFDNPRSVIAVHDELLGLFGNLNRYNNGSGKESLLSMFNNDPRKIQRKNGTNLLIPKPHFSIIGGIQSSKAYECASKYGDVGLSQRFLFVWPDIIPPNIWTDIALPQQLKKNWEALVNLMFTTTQKFNAHGVPMPVLIPLTFEAREHLNEWQNNLSNKSFKEGDELLSSIHSKIMSYVLRFTLILSHMDEACEALLRKEDSLGNFSEVPIGIGVVKRAIKLCEYFMKTSKRAHGIAEEKELLNTLQGKRREAYQNLPNEPFRFSEAMELVKTGVLGISASTLKRFLKEEQFFLKDGNLYIKAVD